MKELYDKKLGANLLALPPEVLFIILSNSLEPHLIHGCRRLRDVLPPFVQWTKALAGIAVCSSDPTKYPFSQYEGYTKVLEMYESNSVLAPLTPSRKRDIREAVFLSTWFKPSRFRDTILSLYYAMPDDLDAFHAENYQFGPRFGGGTPINNGVVVFRLDQFSVAISNHGSAARKQFVRIWLTESDRIEPTAIDNVRMPGLRKANTAEGMVLGFIWASDFHHCTVSKVEATQDGLVHCILDNFIPAVKMHVRQLGSISRSGSLGGVEWKHVVLAAKHSKADIMKLLLERHTWPVWDAVKVRQLAGHVKTKEVDEWEAKYRMLMYECRMQRSHEQYEVQQRLAGQ